MFKLKGYCFLVITLLLCVQSNNATSDEFPLSCPASEDDSNPTHLPYPNDCTKFYKCDRGVPVEQDCPEGLHWSVRTNRCEWPTVAQCQPTESSNSTEIPAYSTSAEGSTESGANGDNSGDGFNSYPKQNNGSSSQSGNGSSTDGLNYLCQGRNGVLLPHPRECSKFIQCSNGLAVVFNCPVGLHWHDAVHKCDYQGNANCDSRIRSNNSYSDENVNQSFDEPEAPESFSNQPPESNRHPGCPIDEDPANPTLLPYTGDCTKFYKCDHGVAYALKCPSGLHWNADLNICDWPANAGCIQINSFRGLYNADQPVKNPNCPLNENTATPTQLPYPGDCSKFYKCFNGYAYPHNCPSGLHWNNSLKVCDWPSNADCKA